jgi:hypothetical protein
VLKALGYDIHKYYDFKPHSLSSGALSFYKLFESSQ